ncbi:MAG: hypothetical protein ACRD0Q_11795 [Acidimicrobiales bacterium]
MSRRVAAVGAVVMLAYVAVAGGTLRLSGRHVRPLFEGVGPNAPYQWVKPPREFAATNVKPHAVRIGVALDAGGSVLSGAGSADGQLVLNLPPGAVPAHDADKEVEVGVTPLDPATLAPLPDELLPDGNAYRVEVAYRPSGKPVEVLAPPGNVVMTVPEPAAALLYSADGRSWARLPTQPVAGLSSVGATFERVGYYMAGALALEAGGFDTGDGGGVGPIVGVGAATVVLALGLGFGPALIRRARRAHGWSGS